MESVRHHALVCLPAVVGDKFHNLFGLLSAAEEHLEELVDKVVIGRQRIIFQDEAGHKLEQALLQPSPHALNAQAAQAIRIGRSVLQANHTAEREAENVGLFET